MAEWQRQSGRVAEWQSGGEALRLRGEEVSGVRFRVEREGRALGQDRIPNPLPSSLERGISVLP